MSLKQCQYMHVAKYLMWPWASRYETSFGVKFVQNWEKRKKSKYQKAFIVVKRPGLKHKINFIVPWREICLGLLSALQPQIACIHSWTEMFGWQDGDKKTRYIRSMSTQIVPNFNTIHYVMITLRKEQKKIQQKNIPADEIIHVQYTVCIYVLASD